MSPWPGSRRAIAWSSARKASCVSIDRLVAQPTTLREKSKNSAEVDEVVFLCVDVSEVSEPDLFGFCAIKHWSRWGSAAFSACLESVEWF